LKFLAATQLKGLKNSRATISLKWMIGVQKIFIGNIGIDELDQQCSVLALAPKKICKMKS
jgi:hypothetical protein